MSGESKTTTLTSLEDIRFRAHNWKGVPPAGEILKEITAIADQAIVDAAVERNRFRKIIQDYLDGNHIQIRKYDKCPHGRYGYEGCENCIDDYFTKALEGL